MPSGRAHMETPGIRVGTRGQEVQKMLWLLRLWWRVSRTSFVDLVRYGCAAPDASAGRLPHHAPVTRRSFLMRSNCMRPRLPSPCSMPSTCCAR
jgi:hypothetical protein